MNAKHDFGGYTTRYNVRCTDGCVIKGNAFANDDGKRVPLVWNHKQDSIDSILGYAVLEHRDDGVYARCFLNNSTSGQHAREAIKHGDIKCLSVFANRLRRRGPEIVQGTIQEVSMVIAGANPMAVVDDDAKVVMHADLMEDDAFFIWCGDKVETTKPADNIEHADTGKDINENKEEPSEESPKKTKAEIFDSLNKEQKDVVFEMIGIAIDSAKVAGAATEEVKHSENTTEEDGTMPRNVFDQNKPETAETTINHSEVIAAAIADAKRYGSMKESFIAHGIENISYVAGASTDGSAIAHSVTNMDYLFPEHRMVGGSVPAWIKRDTGWVAGVMSGVHRTPFSRIKSVFADLREDEARAKGYIKGKLKKEQVFSLLKRTTAPQTVYKKQKIDRDDTVDITDFDVVAWIKQEMRFMLEEEIARAVLIGDGRLTSDDDKIKEDCIRPISKDEELYTIQAPVTGSAGEELARNFITAAIKGRIGYQGSGQPKLYTTEEMLADMLLLTDANGRDLFADEAALARKLRVSGIVTVPVMENAKGKDEKDLYGLIVNLTDYNIGADRGGAVTMFDDFDIDYNAQKYLIETRCSGALVRPYSAIALVADS